MAKANIKRIAELAGVSTTTVSYVLNNKPGISDETRNRVLQIIEREHYTPAANSPRSSLKRSYDIHLVIDEFTSFGNLFYSTILDTLTTAAQDYGYNIAVSNKIDSFQSSATAKAIKHNDVDGLVFLHDIDSETLLFLRQERIPYVVIDSHRRDASYTRVCADYDTAAYTVTKHLIELGHKQIAYIGDSTIPDFYIATFHGCCRALSEHKLALQPQWLQTDACDFESAYTCMENILNCSDHPTGIVCASDQFALASMHCIQAHGYQIPRDFSVVGIDDLNISKVFYPPLTTIHLDSYEMAARAVEFLNQQIVTQNPELQEVFVIKSDQLTVRTSTGPAPEKMEN